MPRVFKTIFCIVITCLTTNIYANIRSQTLCGTPAFYCIRIKAGQSWKSLFPNPEQRNLVMHINRINILLYPGLVIAIPKNLSTANLMDFSPFPQTVNPPQKKIIVFSPAIQAWAAYDAVGHLIRWGAASGGAHWCPDIQRPCQTKSGVYHIYNIGDSSCKSTKFPLPDGGAPMPYCMFFHGGYALHGEPYGLPGYNASHGCIRLFVSDAEWLNHEFIDGPDQNNNGQGTEVIIEPYR